MSNESSWDRWRKTPHYKWVSIKTDVWLLLWDCWRWLRGKRRTRNE